MLLVRSYWTTFLLRIQAVLSLSRSTLHPYIFKLIKRTTTLFNKLIYKYDLNLPLTNLNRRLKT